MGFLAGPPKIKQQPTPAPVEPTIHKDEEAEARLKAGQEAEKEKKRRGRTSTRSDLGGIAGVGSGIAIS